MTTMKDMCELIVKSKILNDDDGSGPTAREIYKSSPTGELSQVFIWYEMAKHKLGIE